MLIRISPSKLVGLKLLVELSLENADLLKSLIDKAPLALRSENIIANFHEDESIGISHIDKEDLQSILDFLIFANDFIVESDLARINAIQELSKSAIELIKRTKLSENNEFKNLAEDRKTMDSRLEYFLGEDGKLSIISKLRSVYPEHQRIFLSSRILTDVRPVFDDSAENVSAVLTYHSLKITYQNNDEQKTFFVALDNDDIDALIADLEKAKKKRNLIKTSLIPENLLTIEDNT